MVTNVGAGSPKALSCNQGKKVLGVGSGRKLDSYGECPSVLWLSSIADYHDSFF
jgi:hypothetical protein